MRNPGSTVRRLGKGPGQGSSDGWGGGLAGFETPDSGEILLEREPPLGKKNVKKRKEKPRAARGGTGADDLFRSLQLRSTPFNGTQGCSLRPLEIGGVGRTEEERRHGHLEIDEEVGP